jgi:hypothetical protein
VSWWGRRGSSSGDSQGWVGDDAFLVQLLHVSFELAIPGDARLVTDVQAAAAAGIKLALHLEPYAARSAESVRQDLQHLRTLLLDPHGPNAEVAASLLMTPCSCDVQKMCPVIFVYDSYRLHPDDWKTLFGIDGGLRCSVNDVFAIALWLDFDGGQQVLL